MFTSRTKLELSTYLRRERIAAILTGLAIFAALVFCGTQVEFSAIFGGAVALWLFVVPNCGYVLMKAVPKNDRERMFKGWVLHCGWLQMPLVSMPAAAAMLLIMARFLRPSVLDIEYVIQVSTVAVGGLSNVLFLFAIKRDPELRGLIQPLTLGGVCVVVFAVIFGGFLAFAFTMLIWPLWVPP